ncbi:MAG: hypothetical protein Q9220_002591 [cf. Caloplaca sp. 1 TL-2023]
MESSRIFVQGLPPNMTPDGFHQYFAKQSSITDARLISHRRIGYVGYRTPAEAAKAIKYHNKSFINMSRIRVELARSIVQEKATQSTPNASQIKKSEGTSNHERPLNGQESSLKRKRDEEANSENNSKLQEYLQVMQPTSKSRTWANEDLAVEKPKEQHDESYNLSEPRVLDGMDTASNYQDLAKKQPKPTQKAVHPDDKTSENTAPTELDPSSFENNGVIQQDSELRDVDVPIATDDDWLRSRTSRLLGLVDDDEDLASHEPEKNEETLERETAGEANDRANSDDSHEHHHADSREDQGPLNVNGSSDQTNSTTQDTGRLFVRNLPYTATVDDLRHHFEKFQDGQIDEIHVPTDYQLGNNKGFAYVQYTDPEIASNALWHLDGVPFQGRLLHIITSAAKRPSGLDEIAISKLPLKRQQQLRQKATAASSSFNWNSMYMNLLDPTSADAAIKQAHAETHVIQETKAYFEANGVNLESFKRKERGDTTILIKNFAYGTKPEELQKMFEIHGTTRRMLMPPSGTLAIVDFVQADHARSAFRSLAYSKFKESILFLEKAPRDLFSGETVSLKKDGPATGEAQGTKHTAGDLLEGSDSLQNVNISTLFVRNLNFSTTSERLREVFKPLNGFLSARVKTKPDPKHFGQLLSMGFGFLEFETHGKAQAALAAMDGHNLDGHTLLIRASHKGADAAEQRRQEDKAKKLAGRRTKIVIKNLPFETSKKDVRSLFGSYGQLRSVRVPKKFDSSTRGFAFADFVTAREAENAMDALKDTHLLGRRLVLDFAAEDDIDPEQEIAQMQQRVGKQADKVALQRLIGSGRKKFNVKGKEDIDRG